MFQSEYKKKLASFPIFKKILIETFFSKFSFKTFAYQLQTRMIDVLEKLIIDESPYFTYIQLKSVTHSNWPINGSQFHLTFSNNRACNAYIVIYTHMQICFPNTVPTYRVTQHVLLVKRLLGLDSCSQWICSYKR